MKEILYENRLLLAKLLLSITLGSILSYPAPILAKPLVFIGVSICIFIGYSAWE